MRLSSLSLLLSGCAVLALTSPAAAQDAPPVIVVDPPRVDPAVPMPEGDVVRPEQVSPPAAVPDEEPEPPAEPVTPPIPAIWSPSPFAADGQSAYGLYLSGRVASLRGEQEVGAELLARSQSLTPEQPVVGGEALYASLISGDIDAVARLTPTVSGNELLAGAGRLTTIVRTLRDGDARAALARIQAEPFADPYGAVGSYILPAVAAAAGDWETALQPVEAGLDTTAGVVLRDQRAQLLELRRRNAEADAEYQTLLTNPDGARLYRVHYGAFLERQGRRDEALAIYAAALADEQPDPRALQAGRRMRDGGRPPAAPTPRQVLADALDFAALEAGQVDIHILSAIYLRLAEALDPEDTTILRLGQSLAQAHQPDAAREAFARVSAANPIIYASAQIGLGRSLQQDGRAEEALQAFVRADAAAPSEVAAATLLATQYLAMGRHEDALAVLDRPNVNTARQSASIRFLRGSALQELGRIEAAEAELWTALQMAPEDPTLLNHLGYFWVDSGRRVDQGAEMIARAFAANPRDANVQDSLGWAQYRQGDYETAVETLEQAVAKQPSNPEINDHLGDAYWQAGRRREAGWQWNLVLTLEPGAEQRAEIEQKLAAGLPTPPVTGSRP